MSWVNSVHRQFLPHGLSPVSLSSLPCPFVPVSSGTAGSLRDDTRRDAKGYGRVGSEGGKGTEEGASHTPHDGRSGLFIPVPTSVILCLAPTSLRSCRSLPPSLTAPVRSSPLHSAPWLVPYRTEGPKDRGEEGEERGTERQVVRREDRRPLTSAAFVCRLFVPSVPPPHVPSLTSSLGSFLSPNLLRPKASERSEERPRDEATMNDVRRERTVGWRAGEGRRGVSGEGPVPAAGTAWKR